MPRQKSEFNFSMLVKRVDRLAKNRSIESRPKLIRMRIGWHWTNVYRNEFF